MIFFSIFVPFQVTKKQASPILKFPFRLLLVVVGTEGFEELLGSGNDLGELAELSTEKDSDSGFAVLGRVLEPIAEGTVSFPPAPRAAEEDFENGAGD